MMHFTFRQFLSGTGNSKWNQYHNGSQLELPTPQPPIWMGLPQILHRKYCLCLRDGRNLHNLLPLSYLVLVYLLTCWPSSSLESLPRCVANPSTCLSFINPSLTSLRAVFPSCHKYFMTSLKFQKDSAPSTVSCGWTSSGCGSLWFVPTITLLWCQWSDVWQSQVIFHLLILYLLR